MFDLMSALRRRLMLIEVQLENGETGYVARYADAVFGAIGTRTCTACVLATYLRTRDGARVGHAFIDRLPHADKKAIFATIVTYHAQVHGVAILPRRQLTDFKATIAAARSEVALEALARQFVDHHQTLNGAMAISLRAKASSLVA
ncbi:hypothetical protein SAMN02745126_03307 [Enhydrobacter aerosaccus]|uniref:Uncharacterized protein n=1 Tax=Enhydrobacter aerosaccus TaxID=225324 RepID=A0A1T4QLQ1_9HYPH|nr:hypothetical protein [Enhydrobacter aerosaccus]SKA04683.1 hypothetical protein SAMN02745126_03307 [Enhydrobacter aerosaccus]